MARMNIEDQFWLDVADMIEKHPDQDKCIGNAMRFFRYAQEQHKRGKLISEETFKEKGFLEALIPTFAKRTPSGIQAKGAEKYFSWLDQKVEAGRAGGLKSSKRKRDKKGRLLKKAAHNDPQIEISPSDLQPSPSPSPSYSPSSSSTDTSYQTKAGAFIAGYKTRFKNKWGVRLGIQGKDAGIAKRVAESLSYEAIPILLDAFFQMPDAELVKKKHPIFLFEAKLNEIQVFAQNGKFTSNQQASQLDRAAATASQLERIERGEL